MADLIAQLFPWYDNQHSSRYAEQVIQDARGTPRFVEAKNSSQPQDSWSRETTAELEDYQIKEDADRLDQLHSVVLKFSDPTYKNGKGIMFGWNLDTCDIVLPRLEGISREHCYLTFDHKHRLILEDTSTNGTMVIYDEQGKINKKKFRWIIGGDPFVANSFQVISIQIHEKVRFRIVVPKSDTSLSEYKDSVDGFLRYLSQLGIQDRPNTVANSDFVSGVASAYSLLVRPVTPVPTTDSILLRCELLGEGRFGYVDHVWDVSTGAEYASKVFSDAKRFDWKGEINRMIILSHSNILQLKAYFRGPPPSILMDYMPLGDLRNQWNCKRFSSRELRDILTQGLSVLKYLHGQEPQFVHRDIKPDNILLYSRDPIQIKLSDFGLSKAGDALRSLVAALHGWGADAFDVLHRMLVIDPTERASAIECWHQIVTDDLFYREQSGWIISWLRIISYADYVLACPSSQTRGICIVHVLSTDSPEVPAREAKTDNVWNIFNVVENESMHFFGEIREENGAMDLTVFLLYMVRDLWDPEENPDGYVSLGVAENALMHTELTEYINSNVELPPKGLTYGDGGAGSKRLQAAAARFLARKLKPVVAFKPTDICVTNGVTCCIEHLSNLFTDPGDVFLLGRPHYGAFVPDIELRTGAKVECVSFGDADPLAVDSVQAYERTIEACHAKGQRVAGLMLCNPHNPLGRCYPREYIIELMKLCQKHKIHLVSDEIYALSVFRTSDNPDDRAYPFTSLASIPTEGLIDPALTHIIYGMSKDFGANGLRVAFIISQHNPQVRTALVPVVIYSFASSLAESVVTKLLMDDEYVDWYTAENCRRLRRSHERVVEWADHHGLEYAKGVNAAFFMWLNLGKPYARAVEEGKITIVVSPDQADGGKPTDDVVVSPDQADGGKPTDDGNEKKQPDDMAKLNLEENLTQLVEDRLLKFKVFLASGASFGSEQPGWFRIVFSQTDRDLAEGLKRIERAVGLTPSEP
ncbi:hypothetical protein DV735_g2086, partial [Chaetothyriales sp. CBS 134920]